MKDSAKSSLIYLQYSSIVLFILIAGFFSVQLAMVCVLFMICVPGFFKSKFDFFQPENYFFCWYFYYFGIGYFTYKIRCSMGFAQEVKDIVLYKGMVYSLIVAILLRLLLNLIKKRKIELIYANNYFNKNLLPLIISITFINTLITFFYWYKIGGIPILISGYHNSGKASVGLGLGYIEYLQSFISLLMTFQIIILWNKKSKFVFPFLLVIYNSIFLPLLNDSRSGAVGSIILIVMLYSWKRKKVKIRSLFLLGFAVVIIACVWGALRDNISPLLSGMVFMAEVASEYDAYLDIIQIFPSQFEFQYGKTLISCFTLLFPRILMPNKNDFLTGGGFYKEIKHLYHIRVGVRLTLLGEMYMNFGFSGIIISAFILLTFLAMIKMFYHSALSTDNFIHFLITSVILSVSRGFLAGDTATAFTFSFYNLLFLILVICIVVLMKKKSNLELSVFLQKTKGEG